MTQIPARDEFSSITESGPLVDELCRRIADGGPITFRDFMDAALYHPRHGYYNTSAAMTSRGGDYVTSPEVHPIFATLVAKQLVELWRALNRPARFDIIEAGAGRGLLARDILVRVASEPDFRDAARYRICERNAKTQRVQQDTLSEAGIDERYVEWDDALPVADSGCVISNELLDAFPVHRVTRRGDELREVYVTHDGQSFRDAVGPLSDLRLSAYFASLDLLPGEGCTAEVNLEAVAWIAQAASSIERGYVLTFDYGYEATDLYAPWRRDGTLLCFYRQSASSDPYQRIGKQDMTSSIDFTTLMRAGEDAGLTTAGFTDQTDFLLRLGIADGLSAAATTGWNIEEYFARRNVVLDLIDPAKLGRVKVLLQSKDAPSGPFTGFAATSN